MLIYLPITSFRLHRLPILLTWSLFLELIYSLVSAASQSWQSLSLLALCFHFFIIFPFHFLSSVWLSLLCAYSCLFLISLTIWLCVSIAIECDAIWYKCCALAPDDILMLLLLLMLMMPMLVLLLVIDLVRWESVKATLGRRHHPIAVAFTADCQWQQNGHKRREGGISGIHITY